MPKYQEKGEEGQVVHPEKNINMGLITVVHHGKHKYGPDYSGTP